MANWASSPWLSPATARPQVPVSLTLAGNMAQSFGSTTTLTVTVPGAGTTTAAGGDATWGEFGARIEMQITDRWAVDLDCNGTAGGDAMGTALHAGVGASYVF